MGDYLVLALCLGLFVQFKIKLGKDMMNRFIEIHFCLVVKLFKKIYRTSCYVMPCK